MLVSAACAIALGAATAILLTRAITGPVPPAVTFAQLLSACDFSATLSIEQKDEMGVLASNLNGISRRMRAMAVTIQENAEQVSASSAQIAASAQTLANGSQSQASAIEQTSAAVQELTASIEQVAGHAQSQAASGEQGSSAISQVRTNIEEISQSLGGIADLASRSVEKSAEGSQKVRKVVEAINQISSGSERIAGIVTVISDIADQTNLLALNASIEAARAGEHGRGFAVVAEEVSKLADRSAASTKEIETLIRESVRAVASGVHIAEGSQAAMEQIRDSSEQVKKTIVELFRLDEPAGIRAEGTGRRDREYQPDEPEHLRCDRGADDQRERSRLGDGKRQRPDAERSVGSRADVGIDRTALGHGKTAARARCRVQDRVGHRARCPSESRGAPGGIITRAQAGALG